MEINKTTNKKRALGKGLDALIGGSSYSQSQTETPIRHGAEASESQRDGKQFVLLVSPQQIDPNPQQPRRHFKEDDLGELTESIRSNGIIQPLIVSKSSQPGRYTLIAGERRLRAALAAKLSNVPVVVRETTSEEMLRLAILENIQRADLNIVEEAEAYDNLINRYGLTQEQVALKLGKDRSSVTNTLRMLQLPKIIQDDMIHQRLSFGHGKALLSLDSDVTRMKAREVIIKNKLSVRQTEVLCKKMQRPNKTGNDHDLKPNLEYLADTLREHLRTKVKLSGTGARGKIEISYFSASELERVLEAMGLAIK